MGVFWTVVLLNVCMTFCLAVCMLVRSLLDHLFVCIYWFAALLVLVMRYPVLVRVIGALFVGELGYALL